MRIPVAIKVLREATSQKANKEILDVRAFLFGKFIFLYVPNELGLPTSSGYHGTVCVSRRRT